VRRTDYLRSPFFADLGQSTYYDEAIRQFDADTIFLCFSDDIPWCKTRFRDRRFVYIEGLRDIADLFFISLCGGHIIADSSFSWWGAWLNPHKHKKVVAPEKWFSGERADPAIPFKTEPAYCGYHDTRNLLPDEWIRLPV
jgi:hypothetical protein